MILGVFFILMVLAIAFGAMLFGFMWLMENLKAREERKKDEEERRREGGPGGRSP